MREEAREASRDFAQTFRTRALPLGDLHFAPLEE